MVLDINNSYILQNIHLQSAAKEITLKALDKAKEFEMSLHRAVLYYRLFLLSHNETNKKRMAYISAAYEVFKKNNFLIQKYFKIFDNIQKKYVNSLLNDKQIVKALEIEVSSRQTKAALINMASYKTKNNYNGGAFNQILKKYQRTQYSMQALSQKITSFRLRRKNSSDLEKQLVSIKTDNSELIKSAKKNLKTRNLFFAFFPSLQKKFDFMKLKSTVLIIKKISDFSYCFWTLKNGEIKSRIFTIPENQIISFNEKIINDINYLENLRIKIQEQKPALSSSDDINIEAPIADWINYLEQQDVDVVLPDGLFGNFSYESLWKKNISRNYTLESVYLFEQNNGLSAKNLIQFKSKQSSLFGSDNLKYDIPLKQKYVSSLNNFNQNANWVHILDYEYSLQRRGQIIDNSLIHLANIVDSNPHPTLALISFQTSTKITNENLYSFMGATNLLLSGLGCARVIYSLNSRKQSQKSYKAYLQGKGTSGTLLLYSGNTKYLQLSPTYVDKHKLPNRQRRTFKNYAKISKDEAEKYFALSIKLLKEEKFEKALQSINRSIDADENEVKYKLKVLSTNIPNSYLIPKEKFNLKNRLYFLSGNIKEANEATKTYLKKLESMQNINNKTISKKKLVKLYKSVWFENILLNLQFTDPEKIIFEIESKAIKMKLNKKDWRKIIKIYNLSQLRLGQLSNINSKNNIFLKKHIQQEQLKGSKAYFKRLETSEQNVYQSAARVKYAYNSMQFNSFVNILIKNWSAIKREKQLNYLILLSSLSNYYKLDSTLLASLSESNLTLKTWLDFLILPNLKNFNKIEEITQEASLLNFAYGKYYLRNKNIKESINYFTKALKAQKSIQLLDSIMFEILPLALNRKHHHKYNSLLFHLQELLSIAYESMKMKNRQRVAFVSIFKIIKNIPLNPHVLIKQLDSIASTQLSSFLQSFINRITYFASTYSPSIFEDSSYFKINLYKNDNKIISYLKTLKKSKISKKINYKNTATFNLALTYLIEKKKYRKALQTYLMFDANTKLPKQFNLPMKMIGFVETYPNKYYSWSITDNTILFTEIHSIDQFTKNLTQSTMLYLPQKKSKIFKTINLGNDDLIFSSTVRLHKKNYFNIHNSNWSFPPKTKNSAINSLLSIYLGNSKGESKNNFIISNKKLKLIISQNPYLLSKSSSNKTDKIKGWKLSISSIKQKSIFISFLHTFFAQLKKEKSSQSIIETYFKTKQQLKKLYPLASDYNSVRLVYQ